MGVGDGLGEGVGVRAMSSVKINCEIAAESQELKVAYLTSTIWLPFG